MLKQVLVGAFTGLVGQSKEPLDRVVMASHRIEPAEADAVSRQADGELAKLFFSHSGRIVHKWVHYLDIYDRHFGRFRNTPVKFLEIGVAQGGSLEIWRKYFGPDATIFGVDVNPVCASSVTSPNQVRIGSQDDPAFLNSVIAEMGRPDIVLDDGSHIGRHQQKTFEVLFPALSFGGLYVMEDLHTSYWPSHEGGHMRRGTAIEFIKRMIDDLHGWYHTRPTATFAKTDVGAIHIYDSLVVIEKQRKPRLGHIKAGRRCIAIATFIGL